MGINLSEIITAAENFELEDFIVGYDGAFLLLTPEGERFSFNSEETLRRLLEDDYPRPQQPSQYKWVMYPPDQTGKKT